MRKTIYAFALIMTFLTAGYAAAVRDDFDLPEDVVVEEIEAADSTRSVIEEVFLNIPQSIVPILSGDDRLNLLDYYYDRMLKGILNDDEPVAQIGEGTSAIDTITDNYMKVRLTDVSSLEIRIFDRKKGDPLAVMAYTVGGSGAPYDTELYFSLTDSIVPVNDGGKYFKYPKVKDFFEIPKGSVTKMKELEEMVKFPTVEYTLSPDSETITARLTVGEYMSEDDYNIMKLFVRPQLRWLWNGNKFVMEK